MLRIDAIDPEWDGWDSLRKGFRRAGYHTIPFASFANWHESLNGRRWTEYLADRPGALRETIRRRLARAERDPSVEIVCGNTEDTAMPLLAEYEQVYAQSWKPSEPLPRFTAAFVGEAARAGVLRIAVLRRDAMPISAQYWTVENGTATVLKLSHAAGWC
ncbi:GNAT family N-acetyltransferase [Acidisphaera sp. L21]|uniref:GNAT family N-acetyltransferase n=1 Tax=Acidisphaera sp. L21 TaxID=1641851 RepID=UPI00131C93B2|nr:GNAT family N-acetyltransferase [Acidisphaera sp. L21]